MCLRLPLEIRLVNVIDVLNGFCGTPTFLNILILNFLFFWSRVMILYSRASENFWGCLAQSPPKNLGQILAALAISGIFERFSPGPNGPEVGGPVRLFKVIWRQTSEPFWPGENHSNMPEIARAAGIWPKFFGGYWARHPKKFSLALTVTHVIKMKTD